MVTGKVKGCSKIQLLLDINTQNSVYQEFLHAKINSPSTGSHYLFDFVVMVVNNHNAYVKMVLKHIGCLELADLNRIGGSNLRTLRI